MDGIYVCNCLKMCTSEAHGRRRSQSIERFNNDFDSFVSLIFKKKYHLFSFHLLSLEKVKIALCYTNPYGLFSLHTNEIRRRDAECIVPCYDQDIGLDLAKRTPC
jgi:hypothetical protein